MLSGEEENLEEMLENHEFRRVGGVPLGPGDFSFDGLLPRAGRETGIGFEPSVVVFAVSVAPLVFPLPAAGPVVGEGSGDDSLGADVEDRRMGIDFGGLSVRRILD